MEAGLLLTSIIFLPLLGAVLVPFFSSRSKKLVKYWTLGVLSLDFLLSLSLWFNFPKKYEITALNAKMLAFQYKAQWFEVFNTKVHYFLGVDGLSILLILLTTFLGPIVILGAWKEIDEKVAGFCFSVLLLQTGMLGTFMALDLFLFYVFWELMLIPMYFIIGVWGGKRRIYAAVKFVLYTMVGSLLMLLAILYIGYRQHSFNLLELYSLSFSLNEQIWLFGAFTLAFIIKVPMFPFHTWLPDAHVEAPTPGSVILAGILLKMGTYGFIRFAMPLFPDALAKFSKLLIILAIFGIIYGALVAMVQPDMKKLVAYSSVSHLGFVMLGLLTLTPEGVQGGIIQMVNHGLSTGGLFLLVGMIYHRRHSRLIADFGGIAKVVPVFAFFLLFITLSSIGLPGLNGFIGEFLILVGTFSVNKIYAVIAGTGIILGAVYMLWMYRRVMFGPITKSENRELKDLDKREIAILTALAIVILWIGLAPKTFLNKSEPSAKAIISYIKQRQITTAQRKGAELIKLAQKSNEKDR